MTVVCTLAWLADSSKSLELMNWTCTNWTRPLFSICLEQNEFLLYGCTVTCQFLLMVGQVKSSASTVLCIGTLIINQSLVRNWSVNNVLALVDHRFHQCRCFKQPWSDQWFSMETPFQVQQRKRCVWPQRFGFMWTLLPLSFPLRNVILAKTDPTHLLSTGCGEQTDSLRVTYGPYACIFN